MSTDEIRALRDQIARMTARLDALEAGKGDPVSAATAERREQPGGTVSRRHWVRGAAAAAVGGTAAMVAGARPASAIQSPLLLNESNSAFAPTEVEYTGSDPGVGFLAQSSAGLPAASAGYPAALAGWTGLPEQPTGVYGYSVVDTDFDNGVRPYGVVGLATGSESVGVLGKSITGVGVEADGQTYGLEVRGKTAALALRPSSADVPDEIDTFHRAGDLYVREAANFGFEAELWFCVARGTPGEWVKIAGPGQPGGFRGLDPVRVYDSRVPTPLPGRLGGGEERTLDITRSRDLGTGEGVGDVVPTGATALSFNIAVVDTIDGGFLSVAPSTADEFSAATINWSTSGQVLNNGSVTSLAGDGQVKVFGGGAGSTHFVIDVTGYWQ